MKVKELIEELLKMDQEQNVWLCASDGDDLSYDEECLSVESAVVTPRGLYPEGYGDEEGKQYEKVVLLS